MEVEEVEPSKLSLRPIKCEINTLSRPDGSAMLSQGNTVMLAAVYGPSEAKHVRAHLDKPNFEVTYRPKDGIPTDEDKLKESIICSACEATLFPTAYARSDITLIVQEMQSRGGDIACAINCGCLALINSGLDLQCLVAAASCMVDESDEIILDPDEKKVETAKIRATLAFDNVNYDVVAVDVRGKCSEDQYNKIVEVCKAAAKTIFDFYRSVVKKYTVHM